MLQNLNILTLRVISYFADLQYKNYFHGDIKPENILYNSTITSSDVGSLLYMPDTDVDSKIYMLMLYTPGFSSKEHVIDIK